MELEEVDMLNNDFDWFVIINGLTLHIASDGTILPKYIAAHFEEQLVARKRILKTEVKNNISLVVNRDLPYFTDLLNHTEEYNLIMDVLEPHINRMQKYDVFQNDLIFGPEFKNIDNIDVLKRYLLRVYLPEFSKFAERGLVSFDHSVTKDEKDLFHWVVRPSKPEVEHFSDLELPVISLSGKDSINDLFNRTVDIVSIVDRYIPTT